MNPYRGWTKDGKEVRGWYCKVEGKHYIILDDAVMGLLEGQSFVDTGITGFVEVIPETVGQQTGLKDKSGKDVFAGDEVEIAFPNGEKVKGKVIWDFLSWQVEGGGMLANFNQDLGRLCVGVPTGGQVIIINSSMAAVRLWPPPIFQPGLPPKVRGPLTIPQLRAQEATRIGARPGTKEFEAIAEGPEKEEKMAEGKPKGVTCPNCQGPAIQIGNEITCETCDATFVITKKDGAKVKKLGPFQDHEERIKKIESHVFPEEPEPQEQQGGNDDDEPEPENENENQDQEILDGDILPR